MNCRGFIVSLLGYLDVSRVAQRLGHQGSGLLVQRCLWRLDDLGPPVGVLGRGDLAPVGELIYVPVYGVEVAFEYDFCQRDSPS
jgi:hypothetical protein